MTELKPPNRQPTVCCCVVVAAAYTNRGGRPGLPGWGFKFQVTVQYRSTIYHSIRYYSKLVEGIYDASKKVL